MFHESLRILFVGDASAGASRISELLQKTDFGCFELECISSSAGTMRTLARNAHDVCIVDSNAGTNVIVQSRRVGFTAPIIMLTANSAAEILAALHHGVSECLIRNDLTAAALEEAICVVVERARASERQAHYARCYLGLVENASEIIFTHDLNGRYTSFNKAGLELTGYALEELLHMTFLQLVAPEYISLGWQIVVRMLSTHGRALFQTVIVTRDGRRVPIEVSAHLIYREGIPVAVQGAAHEVAWDVPTSSLLADSERQQPGVFEH